MKFAPASLQLPSLLRQLSQPIVLGLALSTACGLMALLFVIWLEGDNNAHSMFTFVLNTQGQTNFHLLTGILVSSLSGLLVYQALITHIRTRERKKDETALIETQAYSQAVVDTVIEAVISLDSNGMIKTVNRSTENMFGYTFSELHGKSINMLMPSPFGHEHNRFIKDYIDINKANVTGTGREMIAIKKDGSTFPIDFSISEVFHQKDRTFVGLIRDISQQRAAEDEARVHREQLAQVSRLNALGEMASGIAHEINQPLAAISLFSQAGKRMLDAGQYERVSEVFNKLSQHAQRAGAIIERIQSMARQHESQKQVTDFAALVSEVAQLAVAEARIHDIDIEIDIAQDLPRVMLDIVQIQQVALNLLRNGVQAMQAINCANGKRIVLSVSVSDNGDIKFAVVDSGLGVSKASAKELFQPFSTSKENGMGMGLTIGRAFIEAHDGRIDFYNNISGGATFYFTLPAIKRDD
jgi:two-component system sensor kinase FixL